MEGPAASAAPNTTPVIPPEESAGVELIFPDEFKNANFLLNAEVAILLESLRESMPDWDPPEFVLLHKNSPCPA